jgi:hypothetical protein
MLAGCASDAEIAQRRAIVDDGKCQSYGAKPGEPAYVQCREQLDAARTGAICCSVERWCGRADAVSADRLSRRAASGAILTAGSRAVKNPDAPAV